MPPESEERIAIESDNDVVTARQRARELAARLELTSTDQTLLATAISEVARNITTYATRGEVLLSIVRDNGGRERAIHPSLDSSHPEQRQENRHHDEGRECDRTPDFDGRVEGPPSPDDGIR